MPVLAKLQALWSAKTLAHAWLFVGTDTQTILNDTEVFMQWLLCTDKQSANACGTCKSCILFNVKTHPDFCRITIQADKAAILIEDMRTLTEFTAAKPQFSQQKVVLIYPAEAMHKQSANSLLKNLEEPVGDTLFFLLATHKDLLLKTIVSRCQVLHFAAAAPMDAETNRIKQQMLADLSAIWVEKSVTVSQIVELWIKRWPNEVLYWFELVLTDLIRFKYTQDPPEGLNIVVPSSKLWTILEQLRRTQYWLGQNQKPNMQLVLEDMLL